MSLVIGVVLAASLSARADFNVDRCTPVSQNAASAAERIAPQRCEPGLVSDDAASGLLSLAAETWGERASTPAAREAEPAVQELPGLPGSASLFLSAALSVGAWHAVRKSRDIHLGQLPEWYHPDAPHQIGHSVAVDLGFAPVAVCLFDEPARERPVFFTFRREAPSRCESQYFLAVEAPRGPPTSLS